MTHFVQKTHFWLALLALFLAACSPSPSVKEQPTVAPDTRVPPTPANLVTPATASNANSKPTFKTSIGVLAIEAVRYVDEVNGARPGPDEKILLILLSKPGQAKLDPVNFSLEVFDKALRDLTKGEVHIAGDDGSYVICSMAGWVGSQYEDFAMGFRIPKSARTLQLFWPENDPIDLHPEG